MGNRARIHQRFGKNSNEVTKREILTNGDYKKKMANVGEKGKKIGQKWRVQGFSQLQRGTLTNDYFIKFINLAKIVKKFGQNLSRMTKEACR